MINYKEEYKRLRCAVDEYLNVYDKNLQPCDVSWSERNNLIESAFKELRDLNKNTPQEIMMEWIKAGPLTQKCSVERFIKDLESFLDVCTDMEFAKLNISSGFYLGDVRIINMLGQWIPNSKRRT